ncbi:hypothetical protein [Chryseobacterium sp.]|uniref:hypothetical protein n=1 Tax=Chryseobacterium sp. TaxID=1871047 RepID=UPI00388D4E0C
MATKFNSKKRVKYRLTLMMVSMLILSVLLTFGFYYSFINIFPIKTLDYLIVILSLAFFLYSIYSLYNSRVIDYDSTSEVLSIKYYLPTDRDISKPNHAFELPKSNIISFKIQDDLFHKYLVIGFENSKGICMKKYFDISSCTKSQITILEIESTDLNRKI